MLTFAADIWQWSELTSFGDLPTPRDFAAAAAIGSQKIVLCGGWDGKKWLSDVYVMDTSKTSFLYSSFSSAINGFYLLIMLTLLVSISVP
jgi:hypothetical protein